MHLRSNGVKLQVSNSKYQVRKTGFAWKYFRVFCLWAISALLRLCPSVVPQINEQPILSPTGSLILAQGKTESFGRRPGSHIKKHLAG